MSTSTDAEGDEEIVRRMRGCDEAGLEALLRTYGPRVKAWLRLRFGLNAGDHSLDDAVHDAALIMFKRAQRLDASKSVSGFFYKTARRELMRTLRQRNRDPLLLDGDAEEIPDPGLPPSPGPFSIALVACLQSLPESEREILSLDAASGFAMSAAEIAELLETTVETVYSQRNRTKKRLDEFLRRWKDH